MSGEAESARPLPRSLEAERAVLGGLMLEPAKMSEVAEIVTEEDFYPEGHQLIFKLMKEMSERGSPTEMVAVVDALSRSGRIDMVGGISYVSALPDNVPSTANIEYYARVVKERSLSRKLIASAREISSEAFGGQKELGELLDFAEKSIFDVTQLRQKADWARISQVVDGEIMRIQDLSTRSGEVSGVSTGFVDLDRMLAGLHPSDLVILAARPAMGKTAFVLSIARRVAGDLAGQPLHGVGIFSLEMSKGQLATRLLCSEARVDAGKVRTGFLSREQDWPRLTEAAERLYHLPIYIDDTPGVTPQEVRTKARRLKAQDPSLALIIVDYIGLMGGDPKVSREQQVSTSSRALKGLAKELGVTVICLSQLNRGVENRNPKIPQLADLRESGAIEQDADVILFIYRDEYYNPDSPKKGEAEIIIAKQRNGPTGSVDLAFLGQYTLFENLDRRGGGYQ
jgi:replicative DNA helicase